MNLSTLLTSVKNLPTRTKWLLGGLGATLAFYAWSRTKQGVLALQSGLDMVFTKPISGRITSPYGMRTDPISGQQSGHNGVDFGVSIGTPILAPFDGVVTMSSYVDPATVYPSPDAVGMAKWLDKDGKIPSPAPANYWTAASGNAVGVKDSSGTYTMSFAHMSRRDVQVGQTVKAGQQLGLTGNTGYTTGPHAHVVLKVSGVVVDPMSVDSFAKLFA